MHVIKKFMMNTLAATALMTLPLSTFAQTPSDESINKMMQVMQAEKMGQKMIQQMQNNFSQVFESMKIDENLTPEQEKELNGIINEFMQEMMSDLGSEASVNEMLTYYKGAAKQTYTQDEVNALISFYGSKEGQSIIVKQPVVMQTYMQKVQPFMMKKIQEVQQKGVPELQKKMEDFARKHQIN